LHDPATHDAGVSFPLADSVGWQRLPHAPQFSMSV
jgi:hypothetical protein